MRLTCRSVAAPHLPPQLDSRVFGILLCHIFVVRYHVRYIIVMKSGYCSRDLLHDQLVVEIGLNHTMQELDIMMN